MTEEILTLIAITPPGYMHITCLTSDLLLIIRDCFQVILKQLACYIPLLTPFLPSSKHLPIQEAFSILDNPKFFSQIREVLNIQLANGFETFINIQLIKAGYYLLTKKLVK